MLPLIVQPLDGCEDPPVAVEVKVIGQQPVGNVVENGVLEQNAAEQALFGLQILGGNAVGARAVGFATTCRK